MEFGSSSSWCVLDCDGLRNEWFEDGNRKSWVRPATIDGVNPYHVTSAPSQATCLSVDTTRPPECESKRLKMLTRLWNLSLQEALNSQILGRRVDNNITLLKSNSR